MLGYKAAQCKFLVLTSHLGDAFPLWQIMLRRIWADASEIEATALIFFSFSQWVHQNPDCVKC